MIETLGFRCQVCTRPSRVHPSGEYTALAFESRMPGRHAGTVQSVIIDSGPAAVRYRLVEREDENGSPLQRSSDHSRARQRSGAHRHLAEIKKFPILHSSRNICSASASQEHGGRDAAAQLSHSCICVLSRRSLRWGIAAMACRDVGAWTSEGNIGLDAGCEEVRAGARLPPRVAHAMWWIRASIQEGTSCWSPKM